MDLLIYGRKTARQEPRTPEELVEVGPISPYSTARTGADHHLTLPGDSIDGITSSGI